MSAELGDWLRKQIEARKAAAVAAGSGKWMPPQHETDHMYDDQGDVVVYNEGRPSEDQFAHIARHDPQDTIARCEAELAILDEHPHVPASHVVQPGEPDFGCNRCTGEPKHGWVEGEGWCPTVKHLASGYRFRPGYQEAWKP